jgi:hypothetical protein
MKEPRKGDRPLKGLIKNEGPHQKKSSCGKLSGERSTYQKLVNAVSQ